MKNTLFVYYKVPQAQHAETRRVVDASLTLIQERFAHLEVNLMRRPELSSEGLETWMEVYRHPTGVSQEMKDLIAKVFADSGLTYKRAVEDFIDLND
jgi:Domain of unknown function (DUF4936)